jgi:hypothetical protein
MRTFSTHISWHLLGLRVKTPPSLYQRKENIPLIVQL